MPMQLLVLVTVTATDVDDILVRDSGFSERSRLCNSQEEKVFGDEDDSP